MSDWTRRHFMGARDGGRGGSPAVLPCKGAGPPTGDLSQCLSMGFGR